MTTHRSSLRHLSVLTVTFALMVAGLVLMGRADARPASAAAGDHVQIAPLSGGWGTSVDNTWVITNLAPGGSVSGAVRLRSVDLPNPSTTSLELAATFSSGDALLADRLFITEMTLGGVSLLDYWPFPCLQAAGLPVSQLGTCFGAQVLPVPPGGDGAEFRMTIRFDPGVGNEYQGLELPAVTFVFTLNDTSPDPTPTATATPVTPSPAPSPTPQPLPTVLPGGVGQVIVRHSPPPPLEANAFTLSVSGQGGVSGPGPEQKTGALELNVEHIVSLVGPEMFDGLIVSIDAVACVSDKRGPVSVPVARSFPLTLTEPGEVVTCTFTSSLVAGATGAGGAATPIAPSTGTGTAASESFGRVLFVIGAAIAFAWSLFFGAMVMGARRKREEQR